MAYDQAWAKKVRTHPIYMNQPEHVIQNLWNQNMKNPAFAKEYGESFKQQEEKKAADAAAVKAQAQPAMGGTNAISADVKYDDQGRPIRNDYLSIMDKNGNLNSNFSIADKIGPDIQVNQDGYNAIKERALSTGPSAWANLALEKQGLEQQNAMDSANRSGAQAQTTAYNQMRSRGGLSAGQRERLAMQGARNTAANQQGVLNQGLLNRSNILMEDQKSKDNMLMQLPGMDMANANFQQNQRSFNAQAQQYDIGNKLKDVGGYNAYNADAYGKAMQEWSAGKTADAQARASSGGKK
ncbi:MAG: hypothetical protein KF767_08815 [Bdellovibrionaceae bacterium]|nr:hypothetical protein [Pseudobdellovibrionaceae bacterium]